MDFSPEQRRRAAEQFLMKRFAGRPAPDTIKRWSERDYDLSGTVAIDLQCQINAAVELLRRYPRNGGPSQMVWDNERCGFLADFPVPEVEGSHE